MKFNLSSILVLVFLLSGNSICQDYKNDLERMDLNGRVKSIIETHYQIDKMKKNRNIRRRSENTNSENELKNSKVKSNIIHRNTRIFKFNQNGKITDISSINMRGMFTHKITSKYNDFGNKIEDVMVNADENVISRHYYKYDKKNNLIEMSYYKSDGNLDKKFNYIFDEKGKMIERITSYPDRRKDDKYTYKYDEQGNKIEYNLYSPYSGEIYCSWTYEYNEFGNMIKMKRIYKDGRPNENNIWQYQYDSKGKKIEEYQYKSEEELDRKLIYKYDEIGNLIEEGVYGSDVKKWSYEFDKKSNWIKKIKVMEENARHESIIEREIEYYE